MEFIEKNRRTIKVRKQILEWYNWVHKTDIKLQDVGTWEMFMPCTSCDGFGFVFTGHRDDLTQCQICIENKVNHSPNITGERGKYHYTTKTGKLIRHPSAYSKRGWSSMVYKSSQYFTLTVGLRWVAHSRFILQKDVIKSGIAPLVYELTSIKAAPTV